MITAVALLFFVFVMFSVGSLLPADHSIRYRR